MAITNNWRERKRQIDDALANYAEYELTTVDAIKYRAFETMLMRVGFLVVMDGELLSIRNIKSGSLWNSE